MKFIEQLDLKSGTRCRVELDENDLMFLAQAALHYLQTHPDKNSPTALVAISLSETLMFYRSERWRQFRRMAHRIRKQFKQVSES